MKKYISLLVLLAMCACKSYVAVDVVSIEKQNANTLLDNWHKAAANANFDSYFEMMSDDAIFIGTDPTENWDKPAFKAYSKPYFDKGKAWSFTAVERNIYFSNDGKTAWFDELLDTQMKICRGSGVLKKQNGKWKIAYFVLSMTIPNETTNDVIKLKADFDNKFLENLKK